MNTDREALRARLEELAAEDGRAAGAASVLLEEFGDASYGSLGDFSGIVLEGADGTAGFYLGNGGVAAMRAENGETSMLYIIGPGRFALELTPETRLVREADFFSLFDEAADTSVPALRADARPVLVLGGAFDEAAAGRALKAWNPVFLDIMAPVKETAAAFGWQDGSDEADRRFLMSLARDIDSYGRGLAGKLAERLAEVPAGHLAVVLSGERDTRAAQIKAFAPDALALCESFDSSVPDAWDGEAGGGQDLKKTLAAWLGEKGMLEAEAPDEA